MKCVLMLVTDDGENVGTTTVDLSIFDTLWFLLKHDLVERELATKEFEKSGIPLRDYQGWVPESEITDHRQRMFAAVDYLEEKRKEYYSHR